MEDLETGLDENGLIDFVKMCLLKGLNPRGVEAENNLRWGLMQYRKYLSLQDKDLPQQSAPDLTADFHSIIQRLRPPRPEGVRNMGVELSAIKEAAAECQRWMEDKINQQTDSQKNHIIKNNVKV